MKSIKPGRGPSMMGVLGAAIAVVFGIIWTALTISLGAPTLFPLFGVIFIISGVVMGIYNYKNATGKNRYSTFDITDSSEESDPLQEKYGNTYSISNESGTDGLNGFCPYCGTPAEAEYEFCRKCGKRLPK